MKKILKKLHKTIFVAWKWSVKASRRGVAWVRADRKRGVALGGLAVIVVLGLAGFSGKKYRDYVRANEHIYEALVQPFNQNPYGDKIVDPSALETGDVIVIFPEGHVWSDSEKTSYLILKLKLSEKEANRLIEPVTKEVKRPKAEKAEDKTAEDMGTMTETVRARKYRLQIETLGFDVNNFWQNPVQPYPNQIFGDELIQKKK